MVSPAARRSRCDSLRAVSASCSSSSVCASVFSCSRRARRERSSSASSVFLAFTARLCRAVRRDVAGLDARARRHGGDELQSRLRIERGGRESDLRESLNLRDRHRVGVPALGVRFGARGADAELTDHMCALPRERLNQIATGVHAAARPCTEHDDRLRVQLPRSDEPVECVLQCAGERTGVLGRGDHDRVATADLVPEPFDELARVVHEVRVERRDRDELLGLFNADVVDLTKI